MLCAERGAEGSARLLLDHDADTTVRDAKGYTVLHHAVNSPPLFQLLLKQNGIPVDVADALGLTPLMMAAKDGNAKVVKMLLRRGANVAAIDKFGRSALHHSVSSLSEEVLKLLLDTGKSDLEAREKFGYTALDLAKQMRDGKKMVECLEKYAK